jgi:hypothetical protein
LVEVEIVFFGEYLIAGVLIPPGLEKIQVPSRPNLIVGEVTPPGKKSNTKTLQAGLDNSCVPRSYLLANTMSPLWS